MKKYSGILSVHPFIKNIAINMNVTMKKYIAMIVACLLNIVTNAQNSFTIASGTSLVTSGSINLVFENGNLTNNGTLNDASGTVIFAGPITYSGTGTTSLFNLLVNHNSATSIFNSPVSLGNLFTPMAGTLNANGNLTLLSTAASTASVGAGTGTYIIGDVLVQRYIPGGRRAYRFLSHPFITNPGVGSLTDNIDITGTGGSPFTTTVTNSPSAYGYDNTNANSSLASDPGWQALTANSTFNSKTAYRILVRGTKGQANSLNGDVYIPAAVTLDWMGTLNTGDQVITLTNNGTNRTYNFIGNPYASAVDISLIAKGSNINANFSVWDAGSGTRGAYITQAFSSSFILPSGGAFFTQAAANTNNTITFTEASKSTATPVSLFRNNNAAEDKLVLQVNDAMGNYADKLQLFIDNSNSHYTSYNDELWDAEKMANPDANLYSISKDGKKLAIDRRPIKDNDTVQLGFTNTANANFIFKVHELPTINTSYDFYLRDKWLNTVTLLQANTSVSIQVTNDAASQGNNRFELVTKLNRPVLPTLNSNFTVTVYPNPASEKITIAYDGLNEKEATSIRLLDAEGKLIKLIEAGKIGSGNQNINIKSLSSGVYTVQLINGRNKQTATILKK